MSTLVVDTLTNQEPQLCKAWVNFNGIGTVAIRASYNVSSITDNGTGQYTVNFANALEDEYYAASIGDSVSAGYANGSGHTEAHTHTSTAFQFQNYRQSSTGAGAFVDGSKMSIIVFR